MFANITFYLGDAAEGGEGKVHCYYNLVEGLIVRAQHFTPLWAIIPIRHFCITFGNHDVYVYLFLRINQR